MSLPTTKPAQSSIRSFFQSKSPQYAPPPSQTKSGSTDPPPPPPTTAPTARSDPPRPSIPADLPPLPADLPREASIRPIAAADTNPLRRINALLLPIPYQDDFYRQASELGAPSRVITWAHDGEQPKVVGGVVCRLEPIHPGSQQQTLYIRSLCLLSPYRSLGLAQAALDNIATSVLNQGIEVSTISAHVWTENEEGLKWYKSRGFQHETHPINGYYRKLRPDSAWLVSRDASSASVLSSVGRNGQDVSQPPASNLAPSATAAVVNLPPAGGPPKEGKPPTSRTNSGGASFQNQRPDMEWNDLPADMAPGLLGPPKRAGTSEPTSTASSRSSSTVRKKRDRSYPAAAFGK